MDALLKRLSATPLWKRVGRVHAKIFVATKGRLGGNLAGMPHLLLTTVGRKSGKLRTVPLPFLRDGERYLIVGSNGGADRHPAWVWNLRANPDTVIAVRGSEIPVHAVEAEGDERNRLWEALIEFNPLYPRYAGLTDRVIPVLILTERPGSSAGATHLGFVARAEPRGGSAEQWMHHVAAYIEPVFVADADGGAVGSAASRVVDASAGPFRGIVRVLAMTAQDGQADHRSFLQRRVVVVAVGKFAAVFIEWVAQPSDGPAKFFVATTNIDLCHPALREPQAYWSGGGLCGRARVRRSSGGMRWGRSREAREQKYDGTGRESRTRRRRRHGVVLGR